MSSAKRWPFCKIIGMLSLRPVPAAQLLLPYFYTWPSGYANTRAPQSPTRYLGVGKCWSFREDLTLHESWTQQYTLISNAAAAKRHCFLERR